MFGSVRFEFQAIHLVWTTKKDLVKKWRPKANFGDDSELLGYAQGSHNKRICIRAQIKDVILQISMTLRFRKFVEDNFPKLKETAQSVQKSCWPLLLCAFCCILLQCECCCCVHRGAVSRDASSSDMMVFVQVLLFKVRRSTLLVCWQRSPVLALIGFPSSG